MVENTFNLEDRPALAAVFFVFLVAAHVFVAARLLAFRVLKRQLGLVSIRLKSVVAAVPVTFATILAVRTANHKLNNACAELVPYSYLVRFFIQIALLCFQLRAFIVLRWFTTFGLPQHARKRQRFLAAAFLCMFVPACVLCGLMWGLGLGILDLLRHRQRREKCFLERVQNAPPEPFTGMTFQICTNLFIFISACYFSLFFFDKKAFFSRIIKCYFLVVRLTTLVRLNANKY